MKHQINKNFWKNKKVFITGHTGFKGSWLCIFLNLLGARVTGYSLKPKTNPSLFEICKIKSLIHKSIIADTRNYKKLYSELKKSKASIVIHLAAQPLVRYSYSNPKETFDTNFLGTLNILEAIKHLNQVKRSVIITSDKVYDNSSNKVFREKDKLGGYDPYSASKVCAEYLFSSYLNSFFFNSRQKLATARAGNVIGGGDFSEDRLIPDILKYYKKNKKVIIRNPKAVRPWQHVLEPLSGYLLLVENLHKEKLKKIDPSWNFGPDISSCKNVNYIANYFAKRMKFKIINKIDKKNKNKSETKMLRLSNLKAKKYIKWFPKWNLLKTLDKIHEWEVNYHKKRALKICKDQIKDYMSQ